jgi:chromosome segregation ATPase
MEPMEPKKEGISISLLSRLVVDAVTSKARVRRASAELQQQKSELASCLSQLYENTSQFQQVLDQQELEISSEAHKGSILQALSTMCGQQDGVIKGWKAVCGQKDGVIQKLSAKCDDLENDVWKLKGTLTTQSKELNEVANKAEMLEQENCKLRHQAIESDVITLQSRPLQAQRELKELWLENQTLQTKYVATESELKQSSLRMEQFHTEMCELEDICRELKQKLDRQAQLIVDGTQGMEHCLLGSHAQAPSHGQVPGARPTEPQHFDHTNILRAARSEWKCAPLYQTPIAPPLQTPFVPRTFGLTPWFFAPRTWTRFLRLRK